MKESIKFMYDIPYIKEIIGYLLIPFLIFIIVCSIIFLIYSKVTKDHENPIYKYRINLASLIVSILLIIVFLAMLLGFSIAFNEQLKKTSNTITLSYFVIASPVVPIIALIILFLKTIRLIKNKPNKQPKIECLTEIKNDENNSSNLELLTEETPKAKDNLIEQLEQDDPIKIPINEEEELIIIPEIPKIDQEKEDIEVL